MPKFNDYPEETLADVTDADELAVRDAETQTTRHLTFASIKAWVKGFLGGAALLNVGSTSGTVAAGDDPRFGAGSGGSSSSISNGPGSVSVDAATGRISALIATDSINHGTLFSAGVKTSDENDFGLDIRAYHGGVGDGNRIIEFVPRNCSQVTFSSSDSYVWAATMCFPFGYQGNFHTDTLAYVRESAVITGFRVIDKNTGKTRAYFSGGVQVGEDTALTASTTLTNAHYALYFDTSAGNIAQALPDATGLDGREYVLFKATPDGNTLTISPAPGQGTATALTAQDSCVTYRAFNGKWRKIAQI